MDRYSSIVGVMVGVTSVIAFVPYFLSILKGSTTPSRATWFIWSFSSIIIFLSLKSSGATYSQLFLPGSYLVAQCIIAVLSIKYGEKGWTTLDLICCLGAALSLVFWYVFNNPVFALYLNIAIDLFGALPTFRKAYLRPWTENRTAWFFTFLGASLNLLIISQFTFKHLIYPLYMFVANGIITALVLNIQRTRKTNI